MKVEIAYATPTQQILLKLEVASNSTIKDVIIESQILKQIKEINSLYLMQDGSLNIGDLIETLNVGIFGKQKTLDTIVNEADRIEIYRALHIDPKEARRIRARSRARAKKSKSK